MENKQSGFYYGYVVVAAVFVIMAVIWGFFATFGVFFESFIETFGWTRASTSGASSLRDLIFGVVCILTAKMADQFGPRVVIACTGLLLGAGYLLMSQIQTTTQLYIYNGVILSCGMSSYISMLSIVARWFDRRRGLMTALSLSGMGIGTMIMPPAANGLISTYGWRTSYVILAIAGVVLIVSASQFLKHAPDEPGPASSISGPPAENGTSFGPATLTLREALGTGRFWMLSGMYFIFLYSLLTIMVHVVIHATGLGISSINAAKILAIIGGLSVVGMNCAGGTADRIGNNRTFSACFMLMALSFIFLMMAGTTRSFYGFAIILGLSYGGMQVLFSPLVAELFGMDSHGVILAAAALGGSLGSALGPFISGFVFDKIGGYGWAFFICFIMTVAGAIMASRLRTVRY